MRERIVVQEGAIAAAYEKKFILCGFKDKRRRRGVVVCGGEAPRFRLAGELRRYVK